MQGPSNRLKAMKCRREKTQKLHNNTCNKTHAFMLNFAFFNLIFFSLSKKD